MGKVTMSCNVEIKAESIEDALEKSRTMDEGDFADCLGELNDGSVEITGVYTAD